MKRQTEETPTWRRLPCPVCGAEGSMKSYVRGEPNGNLDENVYIVAGCCIDPITDTELHCPKCGWDGFKSEQRRATRRSVELTEKFIRALNYANNQHAKQKRKSTNIAYISHPVSVAGLIIECGGTEIEAISGLLHDVAEDCGGEPRLAEIKAEFGSKVEEIVRACSDALPKKGAKKPSWRERKEEHIAKLWKSSDSVLLVTAADKTHNARAIVTDLGTIGGLVWERFNASREDVIWYYEDVYKVLRGRGVTSKLLAPLKSAIDQMNGRYDGFNSYLN